MSFIFAFIYAISSVLHFFCVDQCLLVSYSFCLKSTSIISWSAGLVGNFFPDFYLLKKDFFSLFFKRHVEFYQGCCFPHQPFNNVTLLSSELHSSQGKVFCHSCLCASVCGMFFSVSKDSSLAFSSLSICLDGCLFLFFACLFLLCYLLGVWQIFVVDAQVPSLPHHLVSHGG